MMLCLPEAIGVPGLFGQPPTWPGVDAQNGHTPWPTSRSQSTPRGLDDPRWQGHVAIGYPAIEPAPVSCCGGGPAGVDPGFGSATNEDVAFRALYDQAGADRFLYLSWWVKADDLNSLLDDRLTVGFSRTAGEALVLRITPSTSPSTKTAAPVGPVIGVHGRSRRRSSPSLGRERRRAAVLDRQEHACLGGRGLTPVGGADEGPGRPRQRRRSGGPRRPVQDVVRGVRRAPRQPRGAVQLAAQRLRLVVLRGAEPAQRPATGGMGRLPPQHRPRGPGLPDDRLRAAEPQRRRHPEHPDLEHRPVSGRTCSRRSRRTSPAARSLSGEVNAEFRIANWGSVADPAAPWTLIPATGGTANPTPNAAAIANGSQGLAHDEVDTLGRRAHAVRSNGTKSKHQCILVTLTGAHVFNPASVWRNMDFVPASRFERAAIVSNVGLGPSPSPGVAAAGVHPRGEGQHAAGSRPRRR